MWDRLFPGRRSCEACSCLPGLWERGFCGFLRLRSGMGGAFLRCHWLRTGAREWSGTCLRSPPAQRELLARRSRTRHCAPSGRPPSPSLGQAWPEEHLSRGISGVTQKGGGGQGEMGQSTAQTRPRLPSLRPQSEASLEHGLPPAPAPLPCIFPKDWYEAPAPRWGGGAGTQLPGPVAPPLGSRRTEEQVPLRAGTTPSSSAAAQGNGLPLGPAVPLRAGPLPPTVGLALLLS